MGATGSKEVNFEIVSDSKQFSIRRYPAAVIAEVVCFDKYIPDVDDSLQALTEYFGIRSPPKNAEEKTMPMTIPYLLTINDKRKDQGSKSEESEAKEEQQQKSSVEMVAEEQPATKEAGTQSTLNASILTCHTGFISFFLPSEISDPKDAPHSYDKRIEVKQLPSRIVAVRTFHGHFTKKHVTKEAVKLFADLVADNLLAEPPNNGSFHYTVAHYTLGRAFGQMDKLATMVRHEIWVTLPADQPKVAVLMAAHEARLAAIATGAATSGGKAGREAVAGDDQGKESGEAAGESSGAASSSAATGAAAQGQPDI